MPDSETFDAFYARTVWNVTSQLHALAGNDGTADHAIREAYAKAYQQWYQVSGYSDPEGWVLATATDAYERRRAEAVGPSRDYATQGTDSGTWPGIYRPVAKPGPVDALHGAGQGQPTADPDATVAPPRRHGAHAGAGMNAGAPGDSPSAWNRPAADAMAASGLQTSAPPTVDQVNQPAGRLNRLSGPGLGQLGSRRNLVIAAVAAAALVIAVIVYGLGASHKPPVPAASPGATATAAAKPKPHMLGAGLTGRRSAIPWSLVRSGWALAEFSTAQPNSAGEASGTGGDRYSTYLVDPDGGKYKITTSTAGAEPELMAWSGSGLTALLGTASGTAGGVSSYQLLNVKTGQFAQLPLPADVVPVGFARPLGLAILAVRQGPAQFHLQRYSLTGQLQKTLASIPRNPGESLGTDLCGSGTACAISSPDGLTDVWGIVGNQMQVLSNAGGKARRPKVQDGGHPSPCVPISWWNDTTILADCGVTGAPDAATRLWLVPDNGSAPTALTPPDATGGERIDNAWLAGQTTYVDWQTAKQCPSAPSGSGGMDIGPLSQAPDAGITVPGATSNFSTIVGSQGKRLLVLTQTQCPGTSSLLWFNPSTGATQTVLTAPASEVGVTAAVPFGNGPTAVTNGQD
ncbi:MAG TPA: hypothetical protein VMB74_13410 [Streptosporangiaceae bacterium]|nr:hypothetical protein [Streptosporangiaceae bacterium]